LTQNGTHDIDKQFEAGSAGGKFQANEVENVSIRRGYGYKSKRHCGRWWWLHLIIFCVVFLIIALCLVYVAMPKIAQHGVDESSIEFTEVDFLNPTSESIVLTQKAILHSPSMYTPTLDAFNASLWLLTNGVFGPTPMMYIPMPQIHALHPQSSSGIVGLNVSIANLEQVTEYATTVLTKEYVETALTGRTKLHEGALPTTWINYNSSTTYKGLNGLSGFNVTNVKINVTATPGTPNLQGFAYIPNPSFLTVAMVGTFPIPFKAEVLRINTLTRAT
jgi:cytoskeletal protein RodZ